MNSPVATSRSRVLLFTGAGFSAAQPLGLPTMVSFIERLGSKELCREHESLFRLLVSAFDVRDLEALMRCLMELHSTASSLADRMIDEAVIRSWPSGLRFDHLPRLCDGLMDITIDHVFNVYRLELSGIESDEMARRLFRPVITLIRAIQGEPSVSLFTTNYDLAPEYFHQSAHGRELFPSPIVDGFQTSHDGATRIFTNEFGERGTDHVPILRLFKLHGSLNWRRSLARRSVERSDFVQDRPVGPNALSESAVIFPASLKRPELASPFRELLAKWSQELHDAAACLFIGYSFGDTYVASTVADAIAVSGTRIVVVSPSATRNVRENLLIPAFGHTRTDEIVERRGVVCIDLPYAGDLAIRQIAESLRS